MWASKICAGLVMVPDSFPEIHFSWEEWQIFSIFTFNWEKGDKYHTTLRHTNKIKYLVYEEREHVEELAIN